MYKNILLIAALLIATPVFAGGEIALTYDDSPTEGGGYLSGPQRSQKLLAHLQQAKVHTVFFSNSVLLNVEQGRQRLQMYSDAGHLIANHTHSHPNLFTVGAKRFIEDIKTADRELATFPTFVRWFRYPFLFEGRDLEERNVVKGALAEMHYRDGYVTVNTFDWYMDELFLQAFKTGKDIDFKNLQKAYVDTIWNAVLFYDDLAKKSLKRSPKHVLLLHETDLAALYTTDLIARIRGAGWKIITPEEAYTDPIATLSFDSLHNDRGKISHIAAAQGYTGALQPVAESREYLDSLFAEQIYK
jgi:peptidoglycan/xylan/chitin deacetylase (PgdA/CDA1 family)